MSRSESVFAVSEARRGLDALLAMSPHLDVLHIEWQTDGPWLLVELGQSTVAPEGEVWARHRYAIWKRTGAVHGYEADGSVTDDPVLKPRGDDEG